MNGTMGSAGTSSFPLAVIRIGSPRLGVANGDADMQAFSLWLAVKGSGHVTRIRPSRVYHSSAEGNGAFESSHLTAAAVLFSAEMLGPIAG
jgi:hypothetical protein